MHFELSDVSIAGKLLSRWGVGAGSLTLHPLSPSCCYTCSQDSWILLASGYGQSCVVCVCVCVLMVVAMVMQLGQCVMTHNLAQHSLFERSPN